MCGAWYNGSYTIAAKPIKTLELHYTMIQFLINIMAYIYHLYIYIICDGDKNTLVIYLSVSSSKIFKINKKTNFLSNDIW